MNKPYSTQQSAIDLDEFERRLRGPEPLKQNDDPLAELARLVGSEDDRFRDLFDAQSAAPAQRQQAQPGYAPHGHVPPPPAVVEPYVPQDASYAAPPPPPSGRAHSANEFEEDEASALLRDFAERMRRSAEFDQAPAAAPQLPPALPPSAPANEYSTDYTGSSRIMAGGYVPATPPPPPVPDAGPAPRLPSAEGPEAFGSAHGAAPGSDDQWVQPVLTPHPHDEGFGRAGDLRATRPAAPAAYAGVQPDHDDWSGNRYAGSGPSGTGYDGNGDDYPDDVPLPPDEGGRSRKPLYLMAGAMAVMVVGIGATLAMRSGMSGGVPTVTASGDPVKVRPVESGNERKPVRTVSLLNKPDAAKPAASRVVAREEQPIDLNSVKPAPKRPGGDEQELASKLNLGSAQATRPVANTNPNVRPPSSAGGYFPKPRRVRTVRVRPDGTLIADGASNSGNAAPAAAAPARRPPTIAQLATGAPIPRSIANDSGNAGTRGVNDPKTANRATDPLSVSNIARAGGPSGAETPSESSRARAARERREARQAAAEARKTAAEARKTAAEARRRTAALNLTPSQRAAPAASGGGNYAVQLAAPASESAARRAAANAKSRYGSILGGYSPSIVRAVVGSRTVYRVRITGMSRGAAGTMCSQLKSKGGACFVARN